MAPRSIRAPYCALPLPPIRTVYIISEIKTFFWKSLALRRSWSLAWTYTFYGSCTNCIGTNCIGTICIGTNCIGTNCIGNKLYREQTVSGTYCIGNKLYREQIVSGTNCIGSLSFFYPFILFLIHRIPNKKIPNLPNLHNLI